MYLEYSDYLRIIGNPSVNEGNFYSLEVYAEVVIDAFTFNVIGKQRLLEDIRYKESIQKAMAFQIEYMAQDTTVVVGKPVSSRSTSVGGVSESVTYDNSRTRRTNVAGMDVAPMAVAKLSPIRALGRVM